MPLKDSPSIPRPSDPLVACTLILMISDFASLLAAIALLNFCQCTSSYISVHYDKKCTFNRLETESLTLNCAALPGKARMRQAAKPR